MKPSKMSDKSISEEEMMKKYIESMDDKDRTAYEIAKEHLGSSFDLVKSLGYIKFIEKLNKNIK